MSQLTEMKENDFIIIVARAVFTVVRSVAAGSVEQAAGLSTELSKSLWWLGSGPCLPGLVGIGAGAVGFRPGGRRLAPLPGLKRRGRPQAPQGRQCAQPRSATRMVFPSSGLKARSTPQHEPKTAIESFPNFFKCVSNLLTSTGVGHLAV